MNIYRVYRTGPIGSDEHSEYWVIAATPQQARDLITGNPPSEHQPGDEGSAVWASGRTSRVQKVGIADGKRARIVSSTFNPG